MLECALTAAVHVGEQDLAHRPASDALRFVEVEARDLPDDRCPFAEV